MKECFELQNLETATDISRIKLGVSQRQCVINTYLFTPPTLGSPRSCTFVTQKIDWRRKGPPLNTVIGSSTNAPAKIVMSAAVWTIHYLDSTKRQLHNFDLSKPLYIITSQRKNPGRLYLQYSKRWCDFFQWLDQAYDRVSYVLEMVQNFSLE